ncbi:hypothetical protein LDENG_00202100 [Lucifuga dentata]|nr:hypothetical protein LDENG_00202100 [Lucifuga dentata]
MTNVIFSFILVALEKLVELVFACPCDPSMNAAFSSAFFVVPGVLAFLLMLSMQPWKCKDIICMKAVFFSLVPAIVWLLLMLFDGQYFACANTYWPGRAATVDKAPHQKWCESENTILSKELMIKSQQWHSKSQGIGILLLFIMVVLFAVYVIIIKCCKRPEVEASNVEQGRQPPSTSAGQEPHERPSNTCTGSAAEEIPLRGSEG